MRKQTEKQFLKQYRIEDYPRPSIATDIVVFAVMEDPPEENFRKDPRRRLRVLMIKRGSHPFLGKWALPGGFLREDEVPEEAARRELAEETHVTDAYLRPFGIFGKKGRDPRGWILSHAYLSLIDGGCYSVRGGSDAWEAKWYAVDLEQKVLKQKVSVDRADNVIRYRLSLHTVQEDNPDAERLSATIKRSLCFRNGHETEQFETEASEGFAFDHGEILLRALLTLRKEAEGEGKIIFDLMPEVFTLTALQQAFEAVLGRGLTTPNFRRKIAGAVTETEQIADGAGHRPARLFRRNLDWFRQGI